MIDYMTVGQREESAPIVCIPIMPHFLRLSTGVNTNMYSFTQQCQSSVTEHLSASALLSLSGGDCDSIPWCSLRQTVDSTSGPKPFCPRPVFSTNIKTNTQIKVLTFKWTSCMPDLHNKEVIGCIKHKPVQSLHSWHENPPKSTESVL